MARNEKDLIKKWETDIKKALVGKKIANVRYLTDKEQQEMGWFRKALVIIFSDGTYMFPSADDEGNDAGALYTNIKGLDIIPVI